LKKNIAPLKGALQKISALQGLSYVMKGDASGRTEYGFSAQDVQKIYPHLVVERPGPNGKELAITYTGLIAPMVEAIKELKAENDELRVELKHLKQRMEALDYRTGAH
jgi:hypothetical protein